MFTLIFNIFITIIYSLWQIVLCIITGKLPKVSLYHFLKDDITIFVICSDYFKEFHSSKFISKNVKLNIIYEFLKTEDVDKIINNSKQINELIELIKKEL